MSAWYPPSLKMVRRLGKERRSAVSMMATKRGRFPLRDSGRELPDPNTTIDEGNPTSNASIRSVIRLCEILGRGVKLELPRALYRQGWGP